MYRIKAALKTTKQLGFLFKEVRYSFFLLQCTPFSNVISDNLYDVKTDFNFNKQFFDNQFKQFKIKT